MGSAFPDRVEWAVTDTCDLRCRHCIARRRRSEAAELSSAEAEALAGELAARGVRQVTLSGGEPLLRPDWPRIAARLSDHGIEVHLISNGQSLDPAAARTARSAGVRQVLLSLDGLEPTHDAVRGRAGAYRGVLRAARSLATEGLPFGVLTTLLEVNLLELEELGTRIASWGARVWQVWLGIPQERSALWVAPEAMPGVVRRLVALHRRLPILRLGDNLGMGGDCGALRTWTTAGGAVVPPPPAGGRCGFSGCEAGRRVLGIRSDGAVTGCLALPRDRDAGTVRTAALDELAAAAAADRAIRRQRLAGRCRSCGLAERCGGGCHATALAVAGRIENRYCERSRGAGASAPAPRRLDAAATGLAACLALGSLGPGCRAPGSSTDGRATTGGPTMTEGVATPEVVTPPAPGTDGGPDPGTHARIVPDVSSPALPDTSPPDPLDVAAEAEATPGTDAGEAAAEPRRPRRTGNAGPASVAPLGNSVLPSCCLSHMLPGPNCRCGGPPLHLPLQDPPVPPDASEAGR